MSDNPWTVNLAPERMPEGWEFRAVRNRLRELPLPSAWEAMLTNWTMYITVSGYGPTPAAALADAIRKAREATP